MPGGAEMRLRVQEWSDLNAGYEKIFLHKRDIHHGMWVLIRNHFLARHSKYSYSLIRLKSLPRSHPYHFDNPYHLSYAQYAHAF